MTLLLIWISKLIVFLSRALGLGAGSTWPGHIALMANKNFIRELKTQNSKLKTILITGTNGKTTTSKMLRTILETNGQKVIHNEAGANLLNGIASSIVLHSSILGALNYAYAIFEVDENTLPLLLDEITPDVLVVLNLFRDQLDRYGEVDNIAAKWHKALLKLPKNVDVILNADDPQVAFLEKNISAQVSYFGLDDKSLYLKTKPHAMDSGFCPNCREKLIFEGIYLSHLGKWQCKSCRLKRPALDYNKKHKVLPGLYNFYNVQAAILVAKKLNVKDNVIEQSLQSFIPAFGRQEEFNIKGKRIKIFLSKNPTGFNESIRTAKELGAKNVLLVLNDRIPDGRDISWIWDVDFEELDDMQSIVVSGDRVYDLGLRLKYACSSKTQNSTLRLRSGQELKIYEDLREAIYKALETINNNETLYILPTYSAMLEVRKILTGREIL